MKYCRNLAISFITRRDTFTDATSMSWIPEAHPMSPLGWLIVSVFELLLFILVVRKAKYQFWCKRGSSSKEDPKVQDIMEVMAKDSTNYFTMWVHAVKRSKIEYLCLEFYFYKSILR